MSNFNKGRGKYKFNVIDVILIAVIVLSAAAMVFLYFFDGTKGDSNDGDNTVEIIYTVEQKALNDILRGKISMGDQVTVDGGKTYIGQVIDVEYTDAIYSGYDGEGNAFTDKYPGKINVRVRISAKAAVDENGFYNVNGCILGVGKKLDLRFPYYTGSAECILLSEVSK